jgi:hypothetical protein
LYTGRDNLIFPVNPQAAVDGPASLRRLNRTTGNAFVAYDGRLIVRADANQSVGAVDGYIANQSRVTASFAQNVADEVSVEWSSRQGIGVTRGAVFTGVTSSGNFGAVLGADSFIFIAFSADGATALNAIRAIGANLGVAVAGATAAAPPATVAPAPAPVAPNVNNDFARMFAPRDAYAFQTDPALDVRAQALFVDLNRSTGNAFIGVQARVMYRVATNKNVANVFGNIADPRELTAAELQTAALSIARDWSDRKVLKVDRGVAVAGVNGNGGVAVVAFDNYLFLVIAESRQTAQDAAFVVTTNLGARLTE